MSTALRAYNPNACACCTCFTGGAEGQKRGDRYSCAEFSFHALDGSFRYFRTHLARGVGFYLLSGGATPRIAIVSVACTYTGRTTLSGSNLWRFWTQSNPGDDFGIAWDGRTFLLQGAPEATDDECRGSTDYFDFITEALTAKTGRADFWPDGWKPRGAVLLLNELTEANWLALGRHELGEWGDIVPTGTTSGVSRFLTPTDGLFTYDQWRTRFYFKPPASGANLRLYWQVLWTPKGGEAEVYDELSWQWDHLLPDGYDEDDNTTWPRSPWFTLPEASEAGVYSMANFQAKCGKSLPPSAPGDVEGASS